MIKWVYYKSFSNINGSQTKLMEHNLKKEEEEVCFKENTARLK